MVEKSSKRKLLRNLLTCSPSSSFYRCFLLPMAHTIASSSTSASPNKSYHVFINHRGLDVKKTLASHLYHRLCSAHTGLRVFLDKPELRVGDNFPSQIIDAIKTASVHVAIFSGRYAESEWCLNELLHMLDSKAPIIPVFYHVEPAELRWTEKKDGVYAEALRILESKKTKGSQTKEEKPRHSSTTIQKWKEALSRVADISGLELQKTCNGDEGELVEKIVQRVVEEIKSTLSFGTSEFYCSQLYGGMGGADKNDGTYSGIRRITMTEKDNLLTSIQLHYGLVGDESLKERYFLGNMYGTVRGARTEYNLNYPHEIVTKMSGYLGIYKSGAFAIRSLTFHTNQRKLGPSGLEQGTYFETKMEGKIVGVLGSSGTIVDSVGVYMLKRKSSKDEVFYRSQLYGGPGGDYWNDGTYSGIKRITVTEKDNSLTSVQLHYALEGDENGKEIFIFGLRHGGAHGAPIEYNLNYPEEIVIKISGYYGSYKSCPCVIKSLTFHTNQRKLGPYGQEQGTHFETEMGGKIVGLFGKSEDLVDSIGVYMLKPRTSKDEEFYCSQLYGGRGGGDWNDGTYSGIKRITMTEMDNSLTSVQLRYGVEGDESLKDRSFSGHRNGNAGGAVIEYNLNYPNEIVTKISGYIGSYKSHVDVITSLTFHTSERKLGPCGQEQGTYFETEMEGKIVGLFGKSGVLLDSIGVYMLKQRTSKDEVTEGH